MVTNFRFLTSGESHGKCLNAIIEGLPSGLEIDFDFINSELRRRQGGYGRGGRMSIETDTVEVKSGVRFGKTTGAPVCLEIRNLDYENWRIPMSVEPVDFSNKDILREVANKSFTTARPGHADYAGSVKYNHEDLRDVLERSSARKTAIEVAVGSVAKLLLRELGIIGFSHVTQIGDVVLDVRPSTFTLIKEKAEKSVLRCCDDYTTEKMKEAINLAKAEGDTLGGKFEVIYSNLPIGLGSFVHWDRAIDGLLAQAVMSIPAVKAVEVGMGIDVASTKGSGVHDGLKIKNNMIYRDTNNAGGIEGGMTNGEALVITGTMKPIPTMRKPLSSVDLHKRKQTEAHFERSDTCAVPACSVVAESRVAIILVDEILKKYGGDSIEELKKHYAS